MLIEFILTAAFAGLLAAAAISDWRSRVIANFISIVISALFFVGAVIGSQTELVNSALGFCLGATIGIGLFIANVWGGGDAKLLASVALYLGLNKMFSLLLAMSLVGGVMALVFLMIPSLRSDAKNRGLPYGVAIATGGLFIVGKPIIISLIKL